MIPVKETGVLPAEDLAFFFFFYIEEPTADRRVRMVKPALPSGFFPLSVTGLSGRSSSHVCQANDSGLFVGHAGQHRVRFRQPQSRIVAKNFIRSGSEDFRTCGQFFPKPSAQRRGERGWKRCQCLIVVAVTLQKRFKRRSRGLREWDEARDVAARPKERGSWVALLNGVGEITGTGRIGSDHSAGDTMEVQNMLLVSPS